MAERLAKLRLYMVGWMNYFAHGAVFKELVAWDGWIRRRIRMCYWKQWKLPRARRRRLIALGIHKDEVKKASRCSKGHWRCANLSIVQRALNNQWLEAQGLTSLKQQWIKLRYPTQG